MNAELFLEAMGEVDDRYYMEAVAYRADRSRTVVRLLVRAAVAAALLAACTVTAWAVYRAAFQDYFLDPVPTEPAPSALRLSMAGYRGTPEYLALREWLDWQEEHPPEDYLSPDGGDDNADYDWPDYHPFYGAFHTEQGRALDAILEKYGLRRGHMRRAGHGSSAARGICRRRLSLRRRHGQAGGPGHGVGAGPYPVRRRQGHAHGHLLLLRRGS